MKKNGNKRQRQLSNTMIASEIGISAPTLKKAQMTKAEVKEDVYYKLSEWIEK
ncbi:hypothetical protein JK159_09405 [Weissella minor]|uniref:hypothetical protein n=1 Tax=Weissella minor TaxID=1620 RepID=UPI001BAFAD8B|nr:hypothetical protein [Weissella minor]MBS0950562.1 hypothetical protein [Weissella minor]